MSETKQLSVCTLYRAMPASICAGVRLLRCGLFCASNMASLPGMYVALPSKAVPPASAPQYRYSPEGKSNMFELLLPAPYTCCIQQLPSSGAWLLPSGDDERGTSWLAVVPTKAGAAAGHAESGGAAGAGAAAAVQTHGTMVATANADGAGTAARSAASAGEGQGREAIGPARETGGASDDGNTAGTAASIAASVGACC